MSLKITLLQQHFGFIKYLNKKTHKSKKKQIKHPQVIESS